MDIVKEIIKYELIRREFALLSYKHGQDVAVKKRLKNMVVIYDN